MRREPTFSVVLPNYNHAHYIGEALTAIVEQSIKPNEVIVIDVASTDNSVDVIQEFVRRWPFVRFLQNQKNKGVVFTLNRGLQLATGEYVLFTAADDKILPGFFDKSLALLKAHPSASLCSTLSVLTDVELRRLGRLPAEPPISSARYIGPAEALKLFRHSDSWIMGNATIYRTDALREGGGFREELGSFCDGFTSRMLALRHGACFIPEELAVWRRSPSGFATSTGRKPEAVEKIIADTRALMLGPYAALFPKDYVESWTKRTRHDTALGAVESGDLDALRSALGSLSAADQIFLKVYSRLGPAQKWAAKLYLLLRFKPETLGAVILGKLGLRERR